LRQVPLLFPFLFSALFAIFGTALTQEIKLFAFSPFLAILYNRLNFQKSLWSASLCGLMIDLLSAEFALGLYALNYCLTTLLLFNQKKHFLEDKPLALSLFTMLISIVSTVLQWLLMCIFERGLPLSTKLLLTDLIAMPLLDAVYAYVWLSCPMMLYLHIKKIGWRAFYSKIMLSLRFRGWAEDKD
jgi:cell shape-determining protein MreD